MSWLSNTVSDEPLCEIQISSYHFLVHISHKPKSFLHFPCKETRQQIYLFDTTLTLRQILVWKNRIDVSEDLDVKCLEETLPGKNQPFCKIVNWGRFGYIYIKLSDNNQSCENRNTLNFLNLHRAGRVTHQPKGGGGYVFNLWNIGSRFISCRCQFNDKWVFLCAWWVFFCWIDILYTTCVYIYIYIEGFF